jgi:ABC-type bacteriocin/lantibiotic exporter with double-glycine peptidase domain
MDEHSAIKEKPNAPALKPLEKKIVLDNVFFGYDNESRAVLRGVNLDIPAGTMVALVGESAEANRR